MDDREVAFCSRDGCSRSLVLHADPALAAAPDGPVVASDGVSAAAAAAAARRWALGPEEPVGEHGDDGERDEEGREQGDRDGEGEGSEELSGDVADERDGQEHGHRGDGRGGDRARDLLDGTQDRPGALRTRAVVAEREVSLDVLDDHDRVVDHAPDGDRERAQREDVERVLGDLQADEGDEHGRRDGDRRHERGPDSRRNTRMISTAKARPSRPSVVRASMDCSMYGA